MLRPVGGGGSCGAFILATYFLSGRARRCANERRAGGGEGWAGRGGKGVSDARRRVRQSRWSPVRHAGFVNRARASVESKLVATTVTAISSP